jgi:hypothetical protein
MFWMLRASLAYCGLAYCVMYPCNKQIFVTS